MLRLYTLLVPIMLVLIGGAVMGSELGWSPARILGIIMILNAFVLQLHWIHDMLAGIYRTMRHPEVP